MSDQKHLLGKFVWFELVSKDAKKAQAFYGELFGWKAVAFPPGGAYEMIFAGETPDTMIGGYATPAAGEPARWLSYVSVPDVDAAARTAAAAGGTVLDAPADSGGGRRARIADPQGAELCLFRSGRGDRPDVERAPAGR